MVGWRLRLAAGALSAGFLAGACGLWQVVAAGAVNRAPGAGSRAPWLHVSGSHLVDARGRLVVLHGVDRSGGEYACVQGFGIWDGPMGQAAVAAMKRWHVNAVRVPLNEACWHGESYVPRRYRGATYRQAIRTFGRLLHSNGMVARVARHLDDGQHPPCPSTL